MNVYMRIAYIFIFFDVKFLYWDESASWHLPSIHIQVCIYKYAWYAYIRMCRSYEYIGIPGVHI